MLHVHLRILLSFLQILVFPAPDNGDLDKEKDKRIRMKLVAHVSSIIISNEGDSEGHRNNGLDNVIAGDAATAQLDDKDMAVVAV